MSVPPQAGMPVPPRVNPLRSSVRPRRPAVRRHGERLGGDAGRRERDRERAPLADYAPDLQPAAHRVDEALADRQAQAGPLVAVALGVPELEELVEDVPLGLGGDADAGVDDVDLQALRSALVCE